MSTESVELTQHKSSKVWVVVAGRKEFVLSDGQIDILKKADLAGQRGIVWFGDFAISIPHIEAIYAEDRKTVKVNRYFEEVKDENGNIKYKEKE